MKFKNQLTINNNKQLNNQIQIIHFIYKSINNNQLIMKIKMKNITYHYVIQSI
jgi:hypothetical protein